MGDDVIALVLTDDSSPAGWTRRSTLSFNDDLPEDVRDVPLTDSWTDRTAIGGDHAWAKSLARPTSRKRSFRSRLHPPGERSSIVDARHRDADRLPRLSFSFSRSAGETTAEDHEFLHEFGKDRDLDRVTGGLHLPNRMIFPSIWRHRETRVRNRKTILSSSRMPSATCSRSLHRLRFASSTSYDAFRVCLRCNRRTRMTTKVDRSSGSGKSWFAKLGSTLNRWNSF